MSRRQYVGGAFRGLRSTILSQCLTNSDQRRAIVNLRCISLEPFLGDRFSCWGRDDQRLPSKRYGGIGGWEGQHTDHSVSEPGGHRERLAPCDPGRHIRNPRCISLEPSLGDLLDCWGRSCEQIATRVLRLENGCLKSEINDPRRALRGQIISAWDEPPVMSSDACFLTHYHSSRLKVWAKVYFPLEETLKPGKLIQGPGSINNKP